MACAMREGKEKFEAKPFTIKYKNGKPIKGKKDGEKNKGDGKGSMSDKSEPEVEVTGLPDFGRIMKDGQRGD